MSVELATRATGRIPPQHLEAEQAVLGAVLLDNVEGLAALDVVADDDFYFTSHRHVARAMRSLASDEQPVDILTLVERLKRDAHLEDAGGAGYVSSLSNVVPSTANAEHYAKIVREKAILRRVVNQANEWVARGFAGGEDSLSLLRDIAEFAQRADGKLSGVTRARDAAEQLMRELQVMNENRVGRAFVTGIPVIDDHLWVKDTDLFVIAGRPSTGKTTLATDIARCVGESGRGAAYVSAEMPEVDIVARGSKSYGAGDSEVFRKPTTSARLLPVLEAIQKFGRLPIHLCTQTRADEVIRILRKLARAKEITCAVVDMLQRLSIPETWGDNTTEKLGTATKRFKQFALEERCPVFLLSSMNRSAGDDGSSRPTMASLKGSGDIESDADTVLLIHRKNDAISEWIFGKAREGVGEAGRKKQDRGKLSMRRDFARGQFIEAVDASDQDDGRDH